MGELFGPIASLVTTVISRIGPDKTEQEKEAFLLAFQKEAIDSGLMTAQTNIDANEATSTNMFVSGWRPFVGWSFSIMTVWMVGIVPTIAWVCQLFGAHTPPVLAFDPIVGTVLMGLLGLNVGARTWEKIKGVQAKH